MTSRDLEDELESLGIQDDDGAYDSDPTPTNSPPATDNLQPNTYAPFTNYPSSKTSGFWEESDNGRYVKKNQLPCPSK